MFGEYNKISSELYDFTKPIGESIGGDFEYYWNILRNLDGNVLEAGVGTGRLLIPYRRKGMKIDGVDISKEMLEICEDNCKKYNVDYELYHQDLVELNIDKKYGAIIMPTGSFCLINDRKDMKKVLKKFKNHLNKDGRIIIDIILPVDFVEYERKTKIYKLDDRTGIIHTYEALNIDWENQRTYSINRYEKWIDDKLVGEELSEFNINWYGQEEFTLILKEAGFKNIESEWNYGQDGERNTLTFQGFI